MARYFDVMTIRKHFDSEQALNLSGILVVSLIGSLAVYTESSSPSLPLVAFLATALLASFIVCIRSQSNLQQHILFWTMALIITALFFIVEIDVVAVLTIVWIVIAAELYGPQRAALLGMASMAIFLISQIYHTGMGNLLDSIVSTMLYSLLQVFALSVVQRGIRERRLHEETALLNRELLATRELLSQSTAQTERIRIARDLHDILGHHMTALILNLEVANHSVKQYSQASSADSSATERQRAQEKAQEKVEQALALAKLLLGDIRTAVSELRDDDGIDLLASVEKLTEGIPNILFDIDFTSAGQFRSVQLAEILLRCIQEAVTNSIRHSGASQCQIVVKESGGACVLIVRDNGATTREIVPGNGIRGMQERVLEQGGSLNWERAEEGFTLRIELPSGVENED